MAHGTANVTDISVMTHLLRNKKTVT